MGHVIVDGRVGSSERLARLEMFRHDASISVLLMSIGTGAVGYVLSPPPKGP